MCDRWLDAPNARRADFKSQTMSCKWERAQVKGKREEWRKERQRSCLWRCLNTHGVLGTDCIKTCPFKTYTSKPMGGDLEILFNSTERNGKKKQTWSLHSLPLGKNKLELCRSCGPPALGAAQPAARPALTDAASAHGPQRTATQKASVFIKEH